MCLALWVLKELWVFETERNTATRGGQRNFEVEIGVKIVQRSQVVKYFTVRGRIIEYMLRSLNTADQ